VPRPHALSLAARAADRRLVCRSDADSQLLLYVPFNQTVKLSGLKLDGPAEEAPTVCKIWVNSTPIGFDEVEDGAEPAQVIALGPGDVGEDAKEIKLKLVRFQRVNHLHLFFDRPGSDTTALSGIKFYGSAVQATGDLAALGKKPEGEA
jgi:hypothetical protein